MRLSRSFFQVLSMALCAFAVGAQQPTKPANHEQTVFGAENEVERPVPMPDQVLRILNTDDHVRDCMTLKGVSRAPASWFIASEVHLHNSHQVDYVIQPGSGCIFGANTVPFWVFRKVDGRYELLLKTQQLGFEVLKSKTHGYHDIRVTRVFQLEPATAILRFDGHQYIYFSPKLKGS
jgi:hypothetical protein